MMVHLVKREVDLKEVNQNIFIHMGKKQNRQLGEQSPKNKKQLKTGEKIKYLVNKTHLGEILSQAKALQSENTVTEN